MNMLEADEMAEEAAAAAADAEFTRENGRNEVGSKQQRLLLVDPCTDKHCGAGRVCKVRRRREASLHVNANGENDFAVHLAHPTANKRFQRRFPPFMFTPVL